MPDYDSLASKFGGAPDYDAIAAKYSAAPAPAPQPKKGWVERLGSYLPDSYGTTQEKIAQSERTAAETLGEYTPATGIPEMARGVKELHQATVLGKEDPKRAVKAARQTIGGFGKTVAPLAVPALIAAPVTALAGMAGGMGLQEGATRGLKALGVDEDTAGLVGDVAGFIPPGGAASRIAGKFRKPSAPKPVAAIATEKPSIPVPKEEPAARTGSERGSFPITAEDVASVRAKGLKARTQLTDEYAPLKDLEKGKGVSIEDSPYVGARNYAGHAGLIDNRLHELRDSVLRPSKKEGLQDAMRKYAVYERHEELAARIPDYKLPGGQTIADIAVEKAALEAQLGPNLPRVQQLSENLRKHSDGLLTEARDAGLISAADFQDIKAANQKYVPLQRLEYVADKLDEVPHSSNAFSVASQDVVKRIQGSEKEILDPLQAVVRNTYKIVGLAERNKVARKMADLANRPEFAGVVEPLVPGRAPGTGQGKFSVLVDGQKQEFVGPKVVVDSLKGLNRQDADLITQMASISSRTLRAGATSLNVPFLASNIIRDYQTATLVSKVGFTPLDWAKGFAAAIRRGPEFREFMGSGGSFSGYFERNQSLPTSVKSLSESKGVKVLKTVVKPWELLRVAAETTELAPRIGVHMRSRAKGLSQTEAGFNARNATVDFAKAGTATRVANLWIPFLNARLQGTINTLSTVKDRPGHAALVLSTMVGAPILATHAWNKQFQDVVDDIAPYEKEGNFVIVFGREKDKDGNYKQVVKIPKGDVGRIFGNPLQHFLAWGEGKGGKTTGQLATQVASDISPISFEKEGKLSSGAVLGGTLPPTAKAMAEGFFNKNFYTERDIVPKDMQDASPPEQYRSDTPSVFVKLGELTGTSPMKWMNAVGTQFGGFGRQLAEPGKALGAMGKRFAGARGGEQEQREWGSLGEAKRSAADERVKTKRAAEKLYNEVMPLAPEKRQELLMKKIGDNSATPEVLEAFEGLLEKKSSPSFTRNLKSTPVDARAEYMVRKLKAVPADQRSALIDEWAENNLMTDRVIEEIEARLAQ